VGGKRRGAKDARNLLPAFIRALRELAPRAFILENVGGLLRGELLAFFEYVELQLTRPSLVARESETWIEHARRLSSPRASEVAAAPQYRIFKQVLNAADYGVPQMRKRLFVVGFRSELGVEWGFPTPTHHRLGLVSDQARRGHYWERRGLQRTDESTADGSQSSVNWGALRAWRTVRDAIADLPDCNVVETTRTVENHQFVGGARAYPGHTGSRLDWPAKTLKAGVHGVPGGENTLLLGDGVVRYFTIREAARLQTFPDTWRFEGGWVSMTRQLGNAVPVELARVVGEGVRSALDCSEVRRGSVAT